MYTQCMCDHVLSISELCWWKGNLLFWWFTTDASHHVYLSYSETVYWYYIVLILPIVKSGPQPGAHGLTMLKPKPWAPVRHCSRPGLSSAQPRAWSQTFHVTAQYNHLLALLLWWQQRATCEETRFKCDVDAFSILWLLIWQAVAISSMIHSSLNMFKPCHPFTVAQV